MKTELQEQLTKLAFKRTTAFCYGCFIEAPSGRCSKCKSDDLMRMLPGVGCEYGTAWVIKEILSTEFEAVDLDEQFENYCREIYPETTQVGWMTLDTVTIMKEQDPTWWKCAQSEWESEEESQKNIISFDNGSTHYYISDVQNLLDEEDLE